MERNFKGIWIPKEIWLSEELTLQEKIMLVEIDSFDNEERGCYASNKYFSKFFNITPGRISQIISSLVSKGYISVLYIRENQEIKERQMHINRPPYPEVVNKLNTYLENDKRGSKYSKEGYLENDKEDNITMNNISNNINKENTKRKYFDDDELNDMFIEYLSLRKKIKAVNTERAIKGLLNKLEPYPDSIKKEMLEESIVNSWKSVYPLKEEKRTAKERHDSQLKVLEDIYNGNIKLN